MEAALLIAEPEAETRGFLERHLADDGFQVVGSEAPEPPELEPDLVLLGEATPVADVRTWSREVPVIVLGRTGSDSIDRVRAFERGCDDYVPEPFHYEELLARIRAVLRRSAAAREHVEVAGLSIDRGTRRVAVGGRPVALAAKEYELLVKLASEPARVFTKEELLRDVWNFRSKGRTRTLDSHACRLRRKLADAGGGEFVVNQWGVCYRLVEEPQLGG